MLGAQNWVNKIWGKPIIEQKKEKFTFLQQMR